MRILLVSDLHYALPQFDWVVGAAADFDLVVIAGDHLDVSSPVPLEAQSVVVLKYAALIAEQTKLVISSGNHDLTGPDSAGEQCALWLDEARRAGIPTDGDTVLLGTTVVTVCPWWDGDVGKAAVASQLATDAGRRGSRWIWVYHWPPTSSPTSWTGSRWYGDPDLEQWIGEHRPDLVLTGHVHQSPFKPQGSWVDCIGTTWVINPGNQRGPVPAFVEIDLDDLSDLDDAPGAGGVARWSSLMGSEEQGLGSSTIVPRTSF